MKRVVTLSLFIVVLLSGCAWITKQNNVPLVRKKMNMWATIEEAYIYTFPLVLMDATKTSVTNTEKVVPGKAPVNQFIHGATLADAQFKSVVSPNVDTVYSQVWYDLSEEPVIYVLPKTDRFCKVQVLDAWTNTVAILDYAGIYAITLSTWSGNLPEGVTRIDVPTSMAWSITRTVLSGEADLPNVHAIQKEMYLMPLSAYQSGRAYQAPKGSYQEENNYVPIDKVLSMDPVEFFKKANELMEKNQPPITDVEILKKLATVHVGPGMKFDESVLTGDIQANWQEMQKGLRPKLVSESKKFSHQMGQWNYFDAPIGDFGTEYAYRALVAITGLGANTVDVALYPQTDKDADRNLLTGKKSYVLHFDSYPQVLDGGFWSITAYGDDNFLIDNPIDCYCINDRSGLKRNADGSVDVILSKDAPADTTNWLPVGDSGFHLYMRIYMPDMDVIKAWTAPVITTID